MDHWNHLARLFAVLVPAVVAGCKDEPIDESQFTENLCDGGPGALVAMNPAVPVDFAELRFHDDEFHDVDDASIIVEDASGTPCGGATDPDACAAALAALPYESTFGFEEEQFTSGYLSLAWSRADEVGVALDLATLQGFLGPIDATGDAVLLAYMQGQPLLCGRENEVGPHGDGYVVYTETGGCALDLERHVVFIGPDGTIDVIQTELIERKNPGCNVGRIPHGLCTRPVARARAVRPVGSFFADVAHLEAASVAAFERMVGELTVHGAPGALRAAAWRARADEIRHARSTRRLAHRYGGRPLAPRVIPAPPRGLVEVAIDNVTEGCVRETYGAAVAHHQARAAGDPLVRAVLAGIARDETRHAALSWSFADWLESRLGPADRRRVARARATAFEQLRADVDQAEAEEVHRLAGMPRPGAARRLLTGLERLA